MAESSGTSAKPAPSGKQIKLQLSTKQANYALPENTGPILVDTNLRRYPLSILVNHLLGHTEQSTRIPFDFLINGTILRTSIEDYLTANGISAETVLHAEYVPAFVPPKYAASFEHDKWVSSIDVLPSTQAKYGQPLILSGSYDGLARIWNTSSQMVAQSPYTSSKEGAFTKAVKFVSPTRIVTGGFDQDSVMRLLRFTGVETVPGTGDNASITHEADLHHHKNTVSALAADTNKQRLLSASVDHTVALWNTDPSTAPAYIPESIATSTKRQKRSSTSTKHIKPLSVFQHHTHHVTGVSFSPHASDQAYSISSDKTLKIWSLETSSVFENRHLPDPVFSHTAITNMYLIALGTSKGDISLIDPRESAATTKVSTVRQAHSNGFIMALSNDPVSQYRFVSGGYDGMLKIWDIRSLNSPPMTIDRKGGKVFAVKWDADIGILSAGEDCKVRIDK